MNPQDFILLAHELSLGSREAHFRSCVSRAYYGAFHVACALVQSVGVVLPKGASAHEKLSQCLQNAGDPELLATGKKLNSLRDFRNAADYRLDDPRFRNSEFASIQVANAQTIVASIDQVRRDSPAVRIPIRNYARSVLKLNVLGQD
jgi:uncharacterized protein (UPF0332 family)